MTMQMPGDSQTVFRHNGHGPAAAAGLFKKACLDTGLARAAAGAAAEASGWGFAYQPVIVPFKDPVDIGGWYTIDAAVNVGAGMFFNKHNQCNLIVAPADQPSLATMLEAMSAAIGTSPANAADAFDKRGKPRKYFAPEWEVAIGGGSPARISIMPVSGAAGSYQLTALQKVSK